MKKIEAKIICDSINKQGNRVTTMLLTFPRFILAELNTHRMFSKNSASSRAIPFNKMVESIQEDPFIPIAWQKDHKGMQGTKYFTTEDNKVLLTKGDYYSDINSLEERWLTARNKAIQFATDLNNIGLTKQICNRLLEPFLWHTVLLTATEFDNFFELRCPKYKVTGLGIGPQKSKKDWLKHMQFSSAISFPYPPTTIEDWLTINESSAEIHMQALAEAMWNSMQESTPKLLKAGEYHIPYGDQIDLTINSPIIAKIANKIIEDETGEFSSCLPTIDYSNLINNTKIKIAVARCARLSYNTQDNKIDYQKDIELHDRLLESGHFSPFEHVCRCMTDEEYTQFDRASPRIIDGNQSNYFVDIEQGWCNNFKGFIQQRYLLENECK